MGYLERMAYFKGLERGLLGEKPESLHVEPHVLIALVILKTRRRFEVGKMEDIAKVIVDAGEKGVDISDISIRPGARGYKSPDVAQFLGQYLATGYATDSPFKLTILGLETVKAIVREAYEADPQTLEEVGNIIELDIKKVIK